jgi:ABC-type transport system substrate-binding protein
MKKSVFSVFCLSLAALMLVACPSAQQDSSASKVLRVGMTNPNAKPDMHFYQWSSLMTIYDHVVQTLYAYDKDLNVVPLLTTDFPLISEEGTLYTFTLKEGIKFHDGSPLTTEDVAFTFQRTFDPSISGQIAIAAGSYEKIVGAKDLMTGRSSGPLQGFTIIDDRTFSIKLEHSYAPFIQYLAMSYMGIISKSAYLALADKEQWGASVLMGSGSYVFERYHPRDGVSLVANENYWMGSRPAIDRIDFRFFEDPGTALLEYEQGNIDIVELSINRYDEYAKSKFAPEIVEQPTLGTYMLVANFNHEAFSKPLVREAFAYALNREELVAQVYQGTLDVQDTFLPVGMPGRNTSIKAPSYNPSRAKELLAMAGYPDGVSIEATYRGSSPVRRQLWTLIQAHALPAGFNISLREMDIGQHTELNTSGQLELNDAGWMASFPDADDLMYTFFHSTWSHLKSSNLNNARVDELLDAAQRSTDPAMRIAMYEEVEQIVVGDLRAVYPYANIKNLYLIKPSVLNPLYINGIGQFWNSDVSS